MNLRGVVTEADATRVVDTIVLAMDRESVEVFVTPAHRNLQNVMQVGDSAVPTHQEPSPNHRADANERNVNLVGRRRMGLRHSSMLLHVFSSFPQLFCTLVKGCH